MASNRIKGITIEIDGNTTKLSESLKGVDKSLKNTQTQLKDVDRLLKLDPGNVELLTQKQDLLKKAISDTKTRQEELQKAMEAAKSSGDTKVAQEQQDALQRELIETEKQLESYEKQLTNSVGPALQSVSTKAGEVAEKTRGLSTAAGVAAGGMIAMAVSAGKTADDLLTASQQTGFTVEELQKLQYAADLVDVSYDTMTGSIQKLTKQMAGGNKAFEQLGVAITNEDGSMRNATDVWYDAIAALGEVENGTLRDQLSMEIFGKSAMDMAGIVDDGGAKLRTLGEEAETAGIIMGEDAVENAGKFNDALDKVKATAIASFSEAGATLAETLLPTLEQLITIVTDVLSWFANLDGTTQTVILTVLALVAAISPIAGIISAVTGAAAALNVAVLPMIGTMAAIVAGIAAVVAIGVTLYKNWDTIKAKATELWQNLTATFTNIWQSITEKVTAIWTTVTTTFENIKTAIMTPIQAAVDFVSGIVEDIKAFFNFKIELPKIPLPHFGIEPPGWKIGDLLKGSIPHLGIQWYASAMNNGVVLDRPTIFGAQNGQLLGAGEAGPEVVIGAKSLMGMINRATAGAGGVNVSVVVNGNVDNYEALAETIGQKLQQQMARERRAFA